MHCCEHDGHDVVQLLLLNALHAVPKSCIAFEAAGNLCLDAPPRLMSKMISHINAKLVFYPLKVYSNA